MKLNADNARLIRRQGVGILTITRTYTSKQIVMLVSPPVLLATTYAAYTLLARWLGPVGGYLVGFLFYWIVWCTLLPLWIVGPRGLRDMFKDTRPRFGKPAWTGVLLLVGPIVTPFLTMFLPKARELNPLIIIVSLLFAITNGTMEEMLWRGTYIAIFPNSWMWSYWYPSVWFGYWHLSPQVIFPSQMPGGTFAFASMAIFLGLVYGWVVKRTGSIRWVTLSHILTDFMGLAGLVFVAGGY